MPDQRLFVLDVTAALAEWRVLVNGRKVAHEKASSDIRRSAVINFAIRSGRNTVALAVRRSDTRDGTSVTISPPVKLSLSIREGVRGAVPDSTGLRAEWTLRDPVEVRTQDGWVTVWTTEFDAAVPWQASWLRATPRASDAECELLLARYGDALAARDLAAVLSMRDAQIRDVAAALTLPLERARERFGEALRAQFESPLWRVRRSEGIRFVREGEERVIRAVDANGAPVLWGLTEGGELPFDFCCAAVDGRWTIVE